MDINEIKEKKGKSIVLDIETDSLNLSEDNAKERGFQILIKRMSGFSFIDAKKIIQSQKESKLTTDDKIKNLSMKVACIYSYKKNKYLFFNENNIKKLIQILKNSDLIIGYNILDFDYQVLEKYGLSIKELKPKTIDLFDIIRIETGNWISLDTLARKNFDKGKLYEGSKIQKLKLSDLYKYCKRDVYLTKKIFELYIKNKLNYEKTNGKKVFIKVENILNEKKFLSKCPFCGNKTIKTSILTKSQIRLLKDEKLDLLVSGVYYCNHCKQYRYFDGVWKRIKYDAFRVIVLTTRYCKERKLKFVKRCFTKLEVDKIGIIDNLFPSKSR